MRVSRLINIKMQVISIILMTTYIVLSRLPGTEGARVLAVLPTFAKSHHRFFQPVLKTLARAGHEVIVYSPFPLEEPIQNYTDVFLENVSIDNENITRAFLTAADTPYWRCVEIVSPLTHQILDDVMESDKIKTLLSSKAHFDVIFTEFYMSQEFLLYLGNRFKAPVISLHSFNTNHVLNNILGNTLSLSYIPDTCAPFSNKMTFYERAITSISVLRSLYYIYYQIDLPNLENKFRRHFPHAPSLLEMNNYISLIFVNDHLTADYARPRTPNIIPVAGVHIEEIRPLPEPIKSFMDGSSEGVILFSLGTYVKDELQPKEYFDMYINVFRQLRQRVLWKTRKENIQGLPDNVMTVKWAPQKDVLAHPNCVLFITHSGLLSTHEAVHFKVPVVAIPQFWDQHRNARFLEEKGVGVQLHVKNLSVFNIFSAIQTVLNNPKYKNNVRRLSQIFRDRPMTPAQTVVYWTEYVLRHGASHLRPASTQLSWYQLALLDVFVVIFAITLSLAMFTYFACQKIITRIFSQIKVLSPLNNVKYN